MPDFFPPAHNDIFWGTNRFPGAPIMDEIEWTRPAVRTACADITELLFRGQRLWYCCRSPVLPQEGGVDQDNRIAFVDAWTRSRETGLYPVAQSLYWVGKALREWNGTLPWRDSPLLNVVKLRLYGVFPGDANYAELARRFEPVAMKLHVRRTERALREAGLEHVVSELRWPQAAEGAIERHIRDERLFDDLPSKTLTSAAHLDTSACRSQSPLRHYHNKAVPAWRNSGARASARCFRLSQITWRTSVAHRPTEDMHPANASRRCLCENFLYGFKAAPRVRSRRRLGRRSQAPAPLPPGL